METNIPLLQASDSASSEDFYTMEPQREVDLLNVQSRIKLHATKKYVKVAKSNKICKIPEILVSEVKNKTCKKSYKKVRFAIALSVLKKNKILNANSLEIESLCIQYSNENFNNSLESMQKTTQNRQLPSGISLFKYKELFDNIKFLSHKYSLLDVKGKNLTESIISKPCIDCIIMAALLCKNSTKYIIKNIMVILKKLNDIQTNNLTLNGLEITNCKKYKLMHLLCINLCTVHYGKFKKDVLDLLYENRLNDNIISSLYVNFCYKI